MLLRHLLVGTLCATTSCLPASGFAQQALSSAPEAPQSVVLDPLAPLPKLAADQARIYFFRKPQFTAMAADARIALDGTTSGWVGGGSAVFVDHGVGKVTVSIGGGGGLLIAAKPL